MASPQPLDLSIKRPRRSFRAIVAPDMTPMVGVGFLLVSFFLLTTTFAKPTVMQLTMPVRPSSDDLGGIVCRITDVMTIVLGKNGQVFHYDGLLDETTVPEIHKTNLSASGLRKVLLQLDSRALILIKPSDEAKYQDMVDVLDEMNITDRKKYAMVDISAREYDLIKRNIH